MAGKRFLSAEAVRRRRIAFSREVGLGLRLRLGRETLAGIQGAMRGHPKEETAAMLASIHGSYLFERDRIRAC